MEMDEFGIKGNTGLTGDKTGIIHINANYSATGMFFIEEEMEGYPSWKRVNKEDITEDMSIITCFYCDKAAVSLDHSWPWLQECTVCEEHHKKIDMVFCDEKILKFEEKYKCFVCGKNILNGQRYWYKNRNKVCHINCE